MTGYWSHRESRARDPSNAAHGQVEYRPAIVRERDFPELLLPCKTHNFGWPTGPAKELLKTTFATSSEVRAVDGVASARCENTDTIKLLCPGRLSHRNLLGPL
jgi:hypothetical protein